MGDKAWFVLIVDSQGSLIMGIINPAFFSFRFELLNLLARCPRLSHQLTHNALIKHAIDIAVPFYITSYVTVDVI